MTQMQKQHQFTPITLNLTKIESKNKKTNLVYEKQTTQNQ
jgi:hypothetical protein